MLVVLNFLFPVLWVSYMVTSCNGSNGCDGTKFCVSTWLRRVAQKTRNETGWQWTLKKKSGANDASSLDVSWRNWTSIENEAPRCNETCPCEVSACACQPCENCAEEAPEENCDCPCPEKCSCSKQCCSCGQTKSKDHYRVGGRVDHTNAETGNTQEPVTEGTLTSRFAEVEFVETTPSNPSTIFEIIYETTAPPVSQIKLNYKVPKMPTTPAEIQSTPEASKEEVIYESKIVTTTQKNYLEDEKVDAAGGPGTETPVTAATVPDLFSESPYSDEGDTSSLPLADLEVYSTKEPTYVRINKIINDVGNKSNDLLSASIQNLTDDQGKPLVHSNNSVCVKEEKVLEHFLHFLKWYEQLPKDEKERLFPKKPVQATVMEIEPTTEATGEEIHGEGSNPHYKKPHKEDIQDYGDYEDAFPDVKVEIQNMTTIYEPEPRPKPKPQYPFIIEKFKKSFVHYRIIYPNGTVIFTDNPELVMQAKQKQANHRKPVGTDFGDIQAENYRYELIYPNGSIFYANTTQAVEEKIKNNARLTVNRKPDFIYKILYPNGTILFTHNEETVKIAYVTPKVLIRKVNESSISDYPAFVNIVRYKITYLNGTVKYTTKLETAKHAKNEGGKVKMEWVKINPENPNVIIELDKSFEYKKPHNIWFTLIFPNGTVVRSNEPEIIESAKTEGARVIEQRVGNPLNDNKFTYPNRPSVQTNISWTGPYEKDITLLNIIKPNGTITHTPPAKDKVLNKPSVPQARLHYKIVYPNGTIILTTNPETVKRAKGFRNVIITQQTTNHKFPNNVISLYKLIYPNGTITFTTDAQIMERVKKIGGRVVIIRNSPISQIAYYNKTTYPAHVKNPNVVQTEGKYKPSSHLQKGAVLYKIVYPNGTIKFTDRPTNGEGNVEIKYVNVSPGHPQLIRLKPENSLKINDRNGPTGQVILYKITYPNGTIAYTVSGKEIQVAKKAGGTITVEKYLQSAGGLFKPSYPKSNSSSIKRVKYRITFPNGTVIQTDNPEIVKKLNLVIPSNVSQQSHVTMGSVHRKTKVYQPQKVKIKNITSGLDKIQHYKDFVKKGEIASDLAAVEIDSKQDPFAISEVKIVKDDRKISGNSIKYVIYKIPDHLSQSGFRYVVLKTRTTENPSKNDLKKYIQGKGFPNGEDFSYTIYNIEPQRIKDIAKKYTS